jgi:conjugative element/phage-associated large polyvalent protein
MADPHDPPDKTSRETPDAQGAPANMAFNAIEFGSGSNGTASAKKRSGVERAPKAEGKSANDKRKAPILETRAGPVPDSVAERFIQIGNNFFFPDGAEAFTDHGNRVTTRSENTVVIQSMVAIAQTRAKGEVTVQGTEFFKREAWFAAKLAGLDVRGYEPTALEQERLVRAVARRQAAAKGEEPTADPDAKPESSRRGSRPSNEGELIVGRLVDHGPARYHHKSNQTMSYYIRVETDRGDREIWGVDLERAFRQSLSTPGVGDEVGLRAVGRDPVTVPGAKGDLHTHRNQWLLERKEFLDRRLDMANLFRDSSVSAAKAIERYPELEGSYLQLQIARAGTEQRIANPEQREQFVNHLRAHLARTIEYGQPLEPVRLRAREEKAPEPEKVHDRDHAPTR